MSVPIRSTRLVVVAGMLLAVVVLGAPAAGAHAEIRSSDPAAAGTAPSGLDVVTLSFILLDATEPVDVEVIGPSGDDVVSGDPVVDARTSTVEVPVDPLAAGRHEVRWTASSTDGDGLSTGSFTFDVEESSGGGFGVWLLWIVALGIPAAIFLRPGARRKAGRR